MLLNNKGEFITSQRMLESPFAQGPQTQELELMPFLKRAIHGVVWDSNHDELVLAFPNGI